jgi:hypothetical protein
MTLAFRTLTTQGAASGAALTVTKPTGTIDGDIIIVICYLETDTNSWTPDSGFTLAQTTINTGKFRQDIFWKRASGEGASWTFTPGTTAFRIITAVSYSGNSGTGTAIDKTSTNNGNGIITAQTAPSVTTTAAGDMLIFGYSNFNGDNPTGGSGAATNFRSAFDGQTITDAVIATAAATGTTQPSGGTVGTEDFCAAHVALLLASTSGGTSDIPTPLRGLNYSTLVRM